MAVSDEFLQYVFGQLIALQGLNLRRVGRASGVHAGNKHLTRFSKMLAPASELPNPKALSALIEGDHQLHAGHGQTTSLLSRSFAELVVRLDLVCCA